MAIKTLAMKGPSLSATLDTRNKTKAIARAFPAKPSTSSNISHTQRMV